MEIEEMKNKVAELEKAAAELVKDPVAGKSPHVAPLRSRLSAALDSLEAHGKYMESLPPERVD